MEITWDSDFIDLEPLLEISRGDTQKMRVYLQQFLELIPSRIELLQQSVANKDRKTTRQILHQMSPQLQFFGVPGVMIPIQRLALEYQSMEWAELERMVRDIRARLESACQEIAGILKTNF